MGIFSANYFQQVCKIIPQDELSREKQQQQTYLINKTVSVIIMFIYL